MNPFHRFVLAAAVALAGVCTPVLAADDPALARMAACQDSWLDWQKSDPAKLKAFAEHFGAAFAPPGNDPYVVPKAAISVDGLNIAQAFPGSVGMGVGFSLTVDAGFDAAKQMLAHRIGKPLGHCETSDGMRSCELQIADQRTATVMASDDPKAAQTLIGCYYFYEK